MTVEIVGALVANGGHGAPARFLVSPTLDPAPALDSANALKLRNPAARASLALAEYYTASVIGWPVSYRFTWSRQRLRAGSILPSINGPSLFGAFCLALMQAVVRADPAAVRSWNRPLAATVAATNLSRVAVSADFDPVTGSFKPVEIDAKLKALSDVESTKCALCVVAREQTIGLAPANRQLTAVELQNSCEVYTVKSEDEGGAGTREVTIVRAADPADSFSKLFALQSCDGLRAALL